MTPVEAEVIVDLSNDRLRLGDGIEPGGIIIPNARDIQTGKFSTGTALGTDNLLITFDPPYQAYATDMEINWKQPANNTGPMTVEIDGLGSPKALEKIAGGGIVPLIADDVVGGGYYSARFNGTKLLLMSSGGGGVSSVTAADSSLVITPTTGGVTAKVNTNNSMGVGCYAFMKYNGGGTLANGATTTAVTPIKLRWADNAAAFSYPLIVQNTYAGGTWRNISGDGVDARYCCMFQRVS